MPIRKDSIVTCQFGLFGENGFRKSVPVKVLDIETEKNEKFYWIRILGLGVIGKAKIANSSNSRNKTDLYCSVGKFVGSCGQSPIVKNVDTIEDAMAYLGYGC